MIATNFQELSLQTAQWYIEGFNAYVEQGLYDFENSQHSREAVKAETEKLMKWLTKVRYLKHPDDASEQWLRENLSNDYGALGYIMDVVYVESFDEIFSDKLGTTLGQIQEKVPSMFEIMIGSAMFELVQLFKTVELPEVIAFGEIYYDKAFETKEGSDAISYIANKYVARWN